MALSDFPNVEAKREEQRKCLKHVPSRQDRCLQNFTDWLWKKSYFPAFSSNKVCIGMNAIYAYCGNSVDCHNERPSETFEQNQSSGGNDRRRCG